MSLQIDLLSLCWSWSFRPTSSSVKSSKKYMQIVWLARQISELRGKKAVLSNVQLHEIASTGIWIFQTSWANKNCNIFDLKNQFCVKRWLAQSKEWHFIELTHFNCEISEHNNKITILDIKLVYRKETLLSTTTVMW
jgi:hypothetical protein